MPATPADADTHAHRFLQALTSDCVTVPEILRFSIDEKLISPAAIQLATHLFEVHKDAFEELLVHTAKETIQRVMEHLDGTTSISDDQRAVKLVAGTEPTRDLCDKYSADFLATWTTNAEAPDREIDHNASPASA